MRLKVQASEYFARQLSVTEIGPQGLEKLRNSRVAVVGVGGVGSGVAMCLARLGVGYLKLIDQDIVEPTNLHRLQGSFEKDLYRPKAEVVADALACFSPWATGEAVVDTLRFSNAREVLDGMDLIVDCLDNFQTRYVVNHFSIETGKPYLFTSAIASQGHLALLEPPETGCLECWMASVGNRAEESCESLGVTPAIVGFVGSLASCEAAKRLMGLPSKLRGHLVTVDLMGPDFIMSKIEKNPDCLICNGNTLKTRAEGPNASILCGGRTANVLPRERLSLDLETVARTLPKGQTLAISPRVLVFKRDGLVVSIFQNGRILLDGVKDEMEALAIGDALWKQLTSADLMA